MNGWTLKELPAQDRPRERLLASGPGALSNAELLAILLRTGHHSTGQTALDLAQKILLLAGGEQGAGLREFSNLSVEELCKVKGVGMAKAVQVLAALELGRRIAREEVVRPLVRQPADVAGLLLAEMRDLEVEEFRVVLLNTKHYVLAVDRVSVGGLDSSSAHPREIFKRAIRRSAAAMILVHNHPSGDPEPSPEDVQVTRRLAEAGRILGIEVLDHIVVGDGRYVSFRERGITF